MVSPIIWRGPIAYLGQVTRDGRRLSPDGGWRVPEPSPGGIISGGTVRLLGCGGGTIVGGIRTITVDVKDRVIGAELELYPDQLARCRRPIATFPLIEIDHARVDVGGPWTWAGGGVMEFIGGEIRGIALGDKPCWPGLRPVLTPEQMDQIWPPPLDTTNDFAFGVRGDGIIGPALPVLPMTRETALRTAAWLAVLADPHGDQFARVLKAVQST